MYNPYKVAGDILAETAETNNNFSGVDLYGSAIQNKKENAICSEFDQIVVLDKGVVAECGTHDMLMKQSGLYKRMVDLQTEAANWKLV